MSSSPPDPLRITLPVPFAIGHVNCYLLRGDPLTLIDPGPRCCSTLAALEAGLATEGLRVEDLELVLLTHQHEDHTGLAETVRHRSGCMVAAHELVAMLLSDEPLSRGEEQAYELALMQLHGVPSERLKAAPTVWAVARESAASVRIDRRLHDGAVIAAGGRELTVRLRPGHSPTDTLFEDRDGVALVGDHLLRNGPAITLAHRPPTGSSDPRERPRALLGYRRGLQRTAGDGIRVAYPGHGPPVANPQSLIDAQLEAQERSAAQLLSVLGTTPRTAWEVLCAHRGGRLPIKGRHPLPIEFILLSDALAHLDLLVDRGQARELDGGDVVRFAKAVRPPTRTRSQTRQAVPPTPAANPGTEPPADRRPDRTPRAPSGRVRQPRTQSGVRARGR